MKEIIEKLLEEVDSDIRELMLAESETIRMLPPTTYKITISTLGEYYKRWELLKDPANTILNWQAMRDRKMNRDINANRI